MSVEVLFGNVSIGEFQNEMGIEFNQEDFDWFKAHHSDQCKISADSFHIYSAPSWQIYAGENIIDELVKRLGKYDYSKATRSCQVFERSPNE